MFRAFLLRGPKTLSADDRGNVAILFAVLLPLIVGGAGLGVETTYWRYEQLQLQGAADAAAFAGSVEKRTGADDDAVEAAASLAASQNGFAGGVVEVTSPAADRLQVVLRAQAPRFFTKVFVPGPVDLTARAVARVDGASSACVLALSPSAPQAILLSGNAELTLNGCDAMANSIAADAIKVKNATELTASCLVSGGGVDLIGDVTLTSCSAAVTQSPRAADPFAQLPAPTPVGGCLSDNSATLNPGRYCNGISRNSDTHFRPGVYIVSNEFRINGNADITGDGVTIYLEGPARVRINGNATLQLSAPTSGTYAGVLFYGDRGSLGDRNTFTGSADSRLTGALYFPTQEIDYQGNYSGQGGCTQLVARTVVWTGSSSLSVDCESYGMTRIAARSKVRLVE